MNITGIHAWFSLVAQVSFSFSKTKQIEPFHQLLQKDADYIWTPKHQEVFNFARQSIANKVMEDSKAFMPGRKMTVLRDPSKEGIGFILL